MTGAASTDKRIKFFGTADYGTYFQVARVTEFIERFGNQQTDYSSSDILELHNVQLFISHGLLDPSSPAGKVATNLSKRLKALVARAFQQLNDENIRTAFGETLDWQYHEDLLQLLGDYKVYERCSASAVMAALDAAHVGLGEMLTEKRLVKSAGALLRERLLASPENARLVARIYLEKRDGQSLHLPAEFTMHDAQKSLDSYLDASSPHPNVVELIASAKVAANGPVTAKIKLKARRLHQRLTDDFFSGNSGMRTGAEISLSDAQDEPVALRMEDGLVKFSYSRSWFEGTLDNLSILGNLVEVFQWVDARGVMTMPSFTAERGTLEGLLRVQGHDAYPIGTAFNVKEMTSTMQAHFYQLFLESKNRDLEGALEWFFAKHLADVFGAQGFRYMPSSSSATYLQRCRHLFVEMESVAKQFTLYVENGELDAGLMAMASDQVRYQDIPSSIPDKYAYVTHSVDGRRVLHLLFSDQASLGYIDESLHGKNLAELLLRNTVPYNAFRDYQRVHIDELIRKGVLRDEGGRVWYANPGQFVALQALHESEVANYYWFAPDTRLAIDEMVGLGWLERRPSLLARPEASYFNYQLNQREFSNGPDLRNRYMHGSHEDPANEAEHLNSYLIALKLLLVLAIKMHEDLSVSTQLQQFLADH